MRGRSTIRRERLEVVVACDGSPDATAERAREAGADVVLDLPRGGKIRAQDAAVARSTADIVAFSDANALWEPDALRSLVAAFEDPDVGYACGQVRFVDSGGTNQEGLYWRYEMALRELESRLASVTGGNGAIYATRREDYIVVDPIMGHDLSFPFNMVKRGRRAVYVPAARATEKMVPSIEGEFARKRRMMSHAWPIVVKGGLLSPRGYPPLYALMIASHRALRYAAPRAARGRPRRPARRCCDEGAVYRAAFAAPGRAPGRRGGRRAVAAGPPAARRPLLRPHDRLGRRRPLRLGAPRHAGRLGAARGNAVTPPMRRAFDIAVAGTALLVTSPFLAVAMIAIRLESPGHPIYRQRRIGKDGREFDVLKLRTMVSGAEHMGAGLAVTQSDARITRVGAFLRRTSLDEVPNLVNVLKGEMSIIGPRPTVPVQVGQYTERQRGRLAVKPGHHRLGAGQRPHGASLGRAHRARPLVHREPLARARRQDPLADGAHGPHRPRPVPRRGAGLAGAEREARLGHELGTLVDVRVAEGANRVEDPVVELRAAEEVAPGRRGDLVGHLRVVLQQDRVVALGAVDLLVEERLELVDPGPRECRACTG